MNQDKNVKKTYQSSGYKVKVITHTIVQTEYNNILRTPTSGAGAADDDDDGDDDDGGDDDDDGAQSANS